MRIVQLNKVGRQRRPDSYEPDPSYSDTDDVGENPVVELRRQEAQAAPAVETIPVHIIVENIRCWTPRHADRGVGSRITFNDGGGFAVAETPDVVLERIQGAQVIN